MEALQSIQGMRSIVLEPLRRELFTVIYKIQVPSTNSALNVCVCALPFDLAPSHLPPLGLQPPPSLGLRSGAGRPLSLNIRF